jgi:Ca2+-binding RTX toxin-like protein
LVAGTGDTDNALFAIADNQLRSNGIFDFETKNSYSIRVRTTDQGGLTFEKQLTVGVTNINETPTDLTLSNSTIAENQAIGTAVGTFTSTDPDTGNTFTYSLVTGTGSTDNALFAISGNQFRSNGIFDFETKNSYSIRVRTTDQGGLTFEKQLTIGVTDLNEIQGNPLINNGRNPIVGTAGPDYLTGGIGAKTLTGGGGNDSFVFTNMRDVGQRIADFTVGEDKLVFAQLFSSLGYTGSDPIADGYIKFIQGTGLNSAHTFLQIDRDGLTGSAIARNFLQVDNITPTQLNNPNNFQF